MSERTPRQPPHISPLPTGVYRPLWSVMIPAYNCSNYLTLTLNSVLNQDRGIDQMQIEVVDDCSTDADVEALVMQIGNGRVKYFRQSENVGSLRNFETCINRATGQYIHLLHGDDFLKQGFYDEIEKLFLHNPEASAAFTGFSFVDEENYRLYDNKQLLWEPGLLHNWLLDIASAQLIQPPAIVVKRFVYEKLGSFYGVHYGEDWEMWVRIAANYSLAHSPTILAYYRVHQSNITSKYFLSGQSMTDALKVVDLMQQYLPDKEKARTKKNAKKHLANYFGLTAGKIYHEFHQPRIALKQARRSMGIHFSPLTFFYWFKIRVKILLRYKMK